MMSFLSAAYHFISDTLFSSTLFEPLDTCDKVFRTRLQDLRKLQDELQTVHLVNLGGSVSKVDQLFASLDVAWANRKDLLIQNKQQLQAQREKVQLLKNIGPLSDTINALIHEVTQDSNRLRQFR